MLFNLPFIIMKYLFNLMKSVFFRFLKPIKPVIDVAF
jgi:hypothetical protein